MWFGPPDSQKSFYARSVSLRDVARDGLHTTLREAFCSGVESVVSGELSDGGAAVAVKRLASGSVSRPSEVQRAR